MGDSMARKVYVISDLHIGGTYGKTAEGRGFRINTHMNELTEFVRTLAGNDSAKDKIELVINGDAIDFLAERDGVPPYWHPFTHDPSEACARLQEIAKRDPAFFAALRELLEKGHRLTILPGSHDIELVLPPVRNKLKEVIGVQSHHDYEFIGNGEAYVVGDALIEPGNRYDSFSMVNHDNLRRVCSLLSRRQKVPQKYVFDPPAGSKMVSWVINEIKEDYKFIDLLKPESDVAVPILLALEPGYRQLLATVAKLSLQARANRMETAALPSIGGDISSDGNSTTDFGSDMGTFSASTMESSPADEEEAALAELLKGCFAGDSTAFLDALPPPDAKPDSHIGSDISAATFINRTLGMVKLLLSPDDQDVGRRLPPLLKALRALQPDRSFDTDFEATPAYRDAAVELMDGGFRFVVFGHTNRPKKIEVKPGCWYLNSGTWSDLMRLPPEIITGSQEVALAKVQQFMLAIARNDLKGWIVFNPTYVRLDVDAGNRITNANVYQYSGPASLRESSPMSKSSGA